MIAKMEKLTFLIYRKEYESFLDNIRQLGVVHIVEKQSGEPDEKLQTSIDKKARYKSLLQTMSVLAENQAEPQVIAGKTADDIVAEYEKIQNEIQALAQQLPVISKDAATMEVWGDFDWESVNKLEAAGYQVKFYECTDRDFKQEWEDDAIIIRRESGHVNFITVSATPLDLGLEPIRLPNLSLSGLNKKKETTEKLIVDKNAELKNFCRLNYTTLERENETLQGDIDLMKVKLSGQEMAGGSVALLEGWIPQDCIAKVKELLDKESVYYEMRHAKLEDNAPIKLNNNCFSRMYEVLTKMYGMPEYAEFDPTPILAPFFSLFFAFCMGDAGYGLALIALGFILKSKMGKSMAGMMNLVITLGIFTTVMGAIMGTFFGINLFEAEIPEGFKSFMISGKIEGTSYDKQMLLALIIGVVHICIAMTVKAISRTVRFGFKESLSTWGWLLLVVGFVATGTLMFFKIIPEETSKWAFICIGGVAAIGIYLLNNIHRNVLINVGAGLWDTYNMATGLLGDVLSYIRLYALGLAGGMLGGVFNDLAFMVNDACGAAIGWLPCGIILLFGHTLNIAMCCLSAFVHPLRLTFVEYFKNSGYQGKGESYKPFALINK